jgi:DNA-binding transcriptional LysR family regulator
MAIIAEAQSPDHLTRQLIDGTLDVAIMLEPAQLDILQIREIARLDFVCVSSFSDLSIDKALASGFIYVDWGLSHGLDHRRAFPDAPEAMTRVSQAKIALEYIQTLGGSAYLPVRMVADYLSAGTLHEVAGAPVFSRPAYAVFPGRAPRMALIEQSLALLQSL